MSGIVWEYWLGAGGDFWKRIGKASIAAINNVAAGAVALGNTYYTVPLGAIHVAKTGNDTSGDGSIDNPYLTMVKAVSMVESDGTIVQHGGEYNEGGDSGSGLYGVTIPSEKTNVTIQNAPGEKVWWTGVLAKAGWTETTDSRWVVDHVASYDNSPTFGRGVDEDTTDGYTVVNPLYPCAAWASMVVLRDAFGIDTILDPVATPADVVSGTFSFDATYPYTAKSGSQNQWVQVTSKAYIGDDPTGKTVYITNKSTALLTLGSGAKIKGIGFHYYGTSMCDFGTVSARPDSSFENVIIQYSTTLGISSLSSGLSMNHCTISNNGAVGIHGDYADGVSLLYSIVSENALRHTNYAPFGSGMKLTRTNGFTLIGNKFDSNYANHFWTDMSCANGVVIGNDFVNGERRAFVFELSDTLLFVNNIVANNGSDGLYIEPSDKLHIWNNTIHHNGWGTDRFTGADLNGFGIRNVNGVRKPPPGDDSICTAPSTGDNDWEYFKDPRRTYPDPDMTWECHDLVLKNNVVSDNKMRTVTYMEDLASPYELSWANTNPQTAGNLYLHSSASGRYPFVGTKADHSGHWIMYSLATVRTNATTDGISIQEVGSNETSIDPVDENYLVTSAAKSLVISEGLPSDIATIAGVVTGFATLGAWR